MIIEDPFISAPKISAEVAEEVLKLVQAQYEVSA